MKITFVIPQSAKSFSFMQPPIGAVKSATTIEREFGHEFDIVDNRVERLPLTRLLQRVESTSPDLLLVTTATYDQSQVYFLGPRLNSILNTIKALSKLNYPFGVCGPHGTTNPSLMLHEISCDFLIQGQFDLTIPLHIKQIEEEILSKKDWKVKLDQPIILSQPLQYPPEWDEELPMWEKVPMDKYFGDDLKKNVALRQSNWGLVMGSRGCPYPCEFCYLFLGQKLTRRSFESVAQEIYLLNNRFNVNGLFFLDYTFTLDKQWVLELCNQLRQMDLRELKWACQTRSDRLDAELLHAMKEAGCSDIWIGIESFAPSTLELSKKKVTPEENWEAVKLIKSFGIQPIAYIMLGLPGETAETLQATLNHLQHLELSYLAGVELATPRPGCALYEQFKDEFPRLTTSWEYVEAASGLLGNDVTPGMLLEAYTWLGHRDSIYVKRNMPEFIADSIDQSLKETILELGRSTNGDY